MSFYLFKKCSVFFTLFAFFDTYAYNNGSPEIVLKECVLYAEYVAWERSISDVTYGSKIVCGIS